MKAFVVIQILCRQRFRATYCFTEAEKLLFNKDMKKGSYFLSFRNKDHGRRFLPEILA